MGRGIEREVNKRLSWIVTEEVGSEKLRNGKTNSSKASQIKNRKG